MRTKTFYKFLIVVDINARSQEDAMKVLDKLNKKVQVGRRDYLGKERR